MQIRIEGNPDFGELTIALEPGERVLAESGAMTRMNRGLDLRSRALGGVFAALGRRLFGGESFFLGEFSGAAGGWLSLAPPFPGTVLHRRLGDEEPLWLTAGSFLACSDGVRLRTRFSGIRGMFSGEGAFRIEARGPGELFFHSYGAVIEKEVDGQLRVDTGHVVAWESGLDFAIRGTGGLKQTLFSGEGLVMEFEGRGRIWLQTRTLGATAGWLTPYLRA